MGDSLFKVAPLTLMALLIWGLSASHYGFIGNAVDPQVMLLLELMAIVPLAISRIQPGVAAGIIATAALLQMLTLSGPGVSALSVPLVVYTCAKYGSRRVSRSYLTIALLGAGLLAIFVGYQQMVASIYPADAPTAMVNLLLIGGFAAAVVLVFWLFGDLAGRKRAQLEAVEEKNRLLERERDQEARLAADAERMRIAREMHDVISHSMSVMIAQADGGRYVLQQDPARAGAAFETIAETGREALTEMRRMLGVLREEQEQLKKRPAPGIHDLPQLIADVRASGLPVELHIAEADIPPLSEGVGLAVYRIVQEALTNTLKHGGAGATSTIWLGTDYASGELALEIHDTGRGAQAPSDGRGSGLLGMAERARLYGGQVTAHPRQDGFEVMARFPLARVGAGRRQKEISA